MTHPIQANASSANSDAHGVRDRLIGFGLYAAYVLIVNAAVTHWIAARLSYHPSLGPRTAIGLYSPFAWIGWQRWYDSASATFNIAYLALMVAIVVGLAVTVLTIGFRTRSGKKHEALHGTAHWASEAELRASGLLPAPGKKGSGVYVGGWQDKRGSLHYLRHNGPEHIAALAPTRSGKGVGLVIPTCLSWPASIVLNDMKAELWNLTAGWRAREAGNTCMKFDPASENDSVAFNPLDEIRIGTPFEVGDTQNLVTIIVDPEGKGLVDHWAKTSHAFLTGLVLHTLYKTKAAGQGTASLYDIAFAISDPDRDVTQLYAEMVANKHDTANHYGINGTHPVVAGAGRDMLNKPDDERGSVLSTAMSFLGLYRDPIVRRNTSRSDFSVMDLMNAERPISLYLVVRAEDKDRMKPLMRLILNQIVRVLLRPEITFRDGRGIAPHKHRLLLMLDEFPSFGRLDIFQEAMAYIAGYGIKAYLIMQDIAQLWAAYGRDETITSNCHVRVAYAPNKIETAEWLSKMSGTTTVVKEQISVSGQRFGGVLQSVSKSFNETSRPLITPDEALRLKAPEKGQGDAIVAPGDMLVFVAGHAPIFGTQSLYFRDPTFLNRSRIAPPANSALASNPPSSPTPNASPDAALHAALWGKAS